MRDGLKQRCITRDLKWGIPVPLDGYRDKVGQQALCTGQQIKLPRPCSLWPSIPICWLQPTAHTQGA